MTLHQSMASGGTLYPRISENLGEIINLDTLDHLENELEALLWIFLVQAVDFLFLKQIFSNFFQFSGISSPPVLVRG